MSDPGLYTAPAGNKTRGLNYHRAAQRSGNVRFGALHVRYRSDQRRFVFTERNRGRIHGKRLPAYCFDIHREAPRPLARHHGHLIGDK